MDQASAKARVLLQPTSYGSGEPVDISDKWDEMVAEVERLRALLDAIVNEPSEDGDWEAVKASNLDAYRNAS
jgi:hypothetical protein